MEQKINEGKITLSEILNVIRKNIILILVIVFLATIGGVVYANAKAPDYTARELVFYKAYNEEDNETINNINTMQSYIDTVVDFCNEGVVLDRANYYYNEFINQQSSGNGTSQVLNLEEFIKDVGKVGYEYDNGENNTSSENYYNASNISLVTNKAYEKSENLAFSFSICYTEGDRLTAYNKARILVIAFKDECVALDDKGERKYFNGVRVEIIDEGLQAITSNVSKNKIILLSLFFGAIGAFAVVTVKNLLDNTIKTKEDLATVSGFPVLTAIDFKEGERV